MKTGSIGLAMLSAVLACGCSAESTGGRPSSADGQAYIIAGEVDDALGTCEMSLVASRIADMFASVSSGDTDVARRFFGLGTNAPFVWFSFSDSIGFGHFTAYDPAGVTTHVQSRHAAGDRFLLRGIEFMGYVPERDAVGVTLFFDYFSGDDGQHRLGFGKGEYHCPTQSIIVMSLGILEKEQWESLYEIHLGSPSVANDR